MSINDKIFDDRLGEILVGVNPRARHIIFRMKAGELHATVPPRTTLSLLRNALENLRPKLEEMVERHAHVPHTIGPDFCIECPHFSFRSCERDDCKIPRITMQQEAMTFFHPPHLDWQTENLQTWLKNIIEEGLRKAAAACLEPRLEALAAARGLHPAGVGFHKSKTRWGSCTRAGRINLSIYLILLPAHLQDYVIQHELTHLLEFNHSDRFWQILNQHTNGMSKALREEIKHYDTSIFCLCNHAGNN